MDDRTEIDARMHRMDEAALRPAADGEQKHKDFSTAPESIGELRARRSQLPCDWKPRDMLVRLLREIDDGTIEPDQMLVAWTPVEDNERQSSAIAFALATKGPRDAIAMIEMAKIEMTRGCR